MELKEMMQLSEDDLFKEIGESILSTSPGAFPPSAKKIIDIGKRWMEDNIEKICCIVCRNERIKKIIALDEFYIEACDIVLEILLGNIADLKPVHPMSVAVLFCKFSYYKLCKCL